MKYTRSDTIRTIKIGLLIFFGFILVSCGSDLNAVEEDTKLAAKPVVEALDGRTPTQQSNQEITIKQNTVEETTAFEVEKGIEIQTFENITKAKRDLVDLLGWFEHSCGFSELSDPEVIAINKRFSKFTDSFMSDSYEDSYLSAYLKPDYQVPIEYRDYVKDIVLVQDDNAVHYYIDFNNASYRGYDISRLELSYAKEGAYRYYVLYFKDASFVLLKPRFIKMEDDIGIIRGGEFDPRSRSINCGIGM